MASAYNTLSLSIVRYAYMTTSGSEPKVNCAPKRARRLDMRLRAILENGKCSFKNSCVSRLYIRRTLGGCSLASVKDVLEDSLIATWCYLTTKGGLSSQYRMFEKLAQRGGRTPTADAEQILQKFGIRALVRAEQRTVEVRS